MCDTLLGCEEALRVSGYPDYVYLRVREQSQQQGDHGGAMPIRVLVNWLR